GVLPRRLRRAGARRRREACVMSLSETPPAGPDGGNARLLRLLLPVIVLAAGIAAWDLVVRLNDVPAYVLPGPGLVLKTLVADRGILFQSLLTTLWTTLEGFIAAAIGGIALALLFNQSKWLEYSLLPY